MLTRSSSIDSESFADQSDSDTDSGSATAQNDESSAPADEDDSADETTKGGDADADIESKSESGEATSEADQTKPTSLVQDNTAEADASGEGHALGVVSGGASPPTTAVTGSDDSGNSTMSTASTPTQQASKTDDVEKSSLLQAISVYIAGEKKKAQSEVKFSTDSFTTTLTLSSLPTETAPYTTSLNSVNPINSDMYATTYVTTPLLKSTSSAEDAEPTKPADPESTGEENKPSDEENKPAKGEAKPSDEETKPTDNETEPEEVDDEPKTSGEGSSGEETKAEGGDSE